MGKIDFKKKFHEFYQPTRSAFSLVNVPPLRYLMIDGVGNPNTSEIYQKDLEALYSVSYTLKFFSKNDLGKDYVVPPLEGLWWADNMKAFMSGDKDQWKWTVMILLPDWISSKMVETAIKTVTKKKSNSELPKLRIGTLDEGQSIQIMHVGSYDDEGPILEKLHKEYMPMHNLTFNGKHHEIYLGDPRKTEASKLKTILRQPVKPL